MPQLSLEAVHDTLFAWCRQHNFAGHDPFDALNSRLFQATPLSRFRTPRLLFTQLTKRSPLSLRAVTRVPPQKNAKGIALFALAALPDHSRNATVARELNPRQHLSDLLQRKTKA